MPFLERSGKPTLFYELDDYTDPWKPANYIMLQHGYARSSQFWRSWVPYLSRYYKVLRPDLRGLGLSDKDFDLSRLDIGDYIEDFRDLLDHLGIDSIHYCGELSAGGLGMVFAAEHPQRVRTLNLVSSPVYMTEEDKKSSLCGFETRVDALRNLGARGWLQASNAGRRFPKDSDPAMLQWTVDEMSKSDTEVLIAYFRWVSERDATPYLSKIQAPVLGLYPLAGQIIHEEHVDRLRNLVPDITIVRMPSSSASLHMTMPAACATEVLHFISQHDGISCHE